MKTHITFFAVAALLFVGTYSSIGQEVENKQEDHAHDKNLLADDEKVELTPEAIAREQTMHLRTLLSLTKTQSVQVHKVCLAIGNQMAALSTVADESARASEIENLEKIKNEKLKEILTDDQFNTYQNSIKNVR